MDAALLDISLIEKNITPRTRAVIPVSLFGQTAAMDDVRRIARQHRILVIEDAAQSFGAQYKGRYSGTLGDYGCTSFYPTKPLGCYGDGGAVFTNDEDKARKIRQLLNHGQSRQYEYKYIGINGRFDSLQAAVLHVKLRHFEKELEQRRRIASTYDEALHASRLIPLKNSSGQHIFLRTILYLRALREKRFRSQQAERSRNSNSSLLSETSAFA